MRAGVGCWEMPGLLVLRRGYFFPGAAEDIRIT